MAKSKSNSTTTEDVLPAYAILRKHPSVRHKAPIHVSEFRGKDGVTRFFRFSEDEKEFKTYGMTIHNVKVTDEPIELNLSNPIDNLRYRRLKEMQALGISVFNPSAPLLLLEEPEAEDAGAVKFFDRKFEALRILKEELSDPHDRREFAHYFGEHEGSDNRVFLNMQQRAEKSPEQFLSAWEDPLRPIYILVRKSIDKGLISLKGDTNLYYFGEQPLGFNFDEIVNTFGKDAALTTILNKRVNE